jgi:HSP20 family protein
MTNLVYFQPWSVMERWHHDIDQIFNARADTSQSAVPNSAPWLPSVDLREEESRFVLRADVPGVALKDIEVSAANGGLTIRGERPARERMSGDGFEYTERAAGTFLRRFTLPTSVRGEDIKACYADGVLEIEIPKQPRAEARRIPVTVN